MFTVLLAAFYVWLYRYTGQSDLVVGTPITLRERPEVQSLLGFFLNTLPIRVQLDGNRCFREVVRQVREKLWDTFSHADLPFEQLVQMAVQERVPGQQPLYQVMFGLIEEEGPLPGYLEDAEISPLPVHSRTSKNDLSLSFKAVGESWDCLFEYATDLFSAAMIGRMVQHLTELLHSITADPTQPISQLNLMSQEERRRVLVEWNQTERAFPRDKCVHRVV